MRNKLANRYGIKSVVESGVFSRLVTLVTAVVAMTVVMSGPALADTFTVKNRNNAGKGSLRAAINDSNAKAGRDLIRFDSDVRGKIDLKKALPVLRDDLWIRGPGASKLVVRRAAQNGFSIFTVAENMDVTISGLKLANGSYRRGGGINNDGGILILRNSVLFNNQGLRAGGIYNARDSKLIIRDSSFFSNRAPGNNHGGVSEGGAIQNYRGRLVISDSTFAGNRASQGGAIETFGSTTITGSTFLNNVAVGFQKGQLYANTGGGGAIANSGSSLTVRNSTFYGNSFTDADGEDGGGAIFNRGRASVVSSTITSNESASVGGGIYNENTFYLRATIVAKNDAPTAPDASGSFNSGGYNLIGNANGATGFGSSDITNVRPGFDSRGLRDNGGPTKTVAIAKWSPATDAVARDACPPPKTDQRGVRRPQDGDGDGSVRCDIGAFERR